MECTSSAIQALLLFQKLHPGHREDEIKSCICKAIAYIEDEQKQDGSWFASLYPDFTFVTFFFTKKKKRKVSFFIPTYNL